MITNSPDLSFEKLLERVKDNELSKDKTKITQGIYRMNQLYWGAIENEREEIVYILEAIYNLGANDNY